VLASERLGLRLPGTVPTLLALGKLGTVWIDVGGSTVAACSSAGLDRRHDFVDRLPTGSAWVIRRAKGLQNLRTGAFPAEERQALGLHHAAETSDATTGL
jgi:hypothetical protein